MLLPDSDSILEILRNETTPRAYNMVIQVGGIKSMTRHFIHSMVFIMLAAVSAQAAIGPVVQPVPWNPANLADPHTVIAGAQATLGAAVNLNGSTDTFTYSWNFGDGSPATAACPVVNTTVTVTPPCPVSNNYMIAGTYTYNANTAPGTTYTAILTVTDTTTSTSYTGNYPVVVQANTLTSRVNMAIDNGLWYLHTSMWRSDSISMPYAPTTNNDDYYDAVHKKAQAIAVPIGGWDTVSTDCPAAVTDSVWGYLQDGYACTYVAGIDANNTQAFEVSGHLENEVNAAVDPYADDVARGLQRIMYFLVPLSTNPDGNKTIAYDPAVQASRCSDGSVPNYAATPPTCQAPATLILYNQGATSCVGCSSTNVKTFTFDGNSNGQLIIEGNDSYYADCGYPTCTTGPGIDPGYQAGMLLTALVASGNPNGTAKVGAPSTGAGPCSSANGALPGVLGCTYGNLVQDLPMASDIASISAISRTLRAVAPAAAGSTIAPPMRTTPNTMTTTPCRSGTPSG